MEIKMCCSESPHPSPLDDWLEAYVTFVTLDPKTKKPMPIPSIVPQTPEEKQEFQNGNHRAQLKKQHRKKLGMITNNNNKTKQEETPGQVVDRHERIEAMAQELLNDASPLLNLPSLANPHDILMDQTAMQNAMIAQPQVQNLHNRIFGGFLMRRAFELAFATVYCFAGARPIFLEVDQVSFTLPVDVGDLLIFRSHVLYTDSGRLRDYYQHTNDQDPTTTTTTKSATESLSEEQEDHVVPLVHVQVEASVTVPEQAKSHVSNLFHFTFGIVPEQKKSSSTTTETLEAPTTTTTTTTPTIRRILPSNIEQARRMASRMVANEEQKQLDQRQQSPQKNTN